MIPEEGEIEIHPLTLLDLKMLIHDWQWDECIVCLEKVGVMPKQGVSSSATFLRGVGQIEGALFMAGISYQEVTPQKWKAEFGCNIGKQASTKEKKAKDIEVCKRLYPDVSLRRTEKCKTDWSDAADALLMATYAKRKF